MKQRGAFVFIIAIFVLLLAIPTISAEKYMKLLAIKGEELGGEGVIADLYVKAVQGKGEIYTATSPLTKIDTQLSTRVARDISCEFSEKSCDDKDLLITIKADNAIVGGPSAGAAVSITILAELEDIDIDETVSITGTINNAGLIGSVGGLKEKIQAAANNSIHTVLIPKGTRYLKDPNIVERVVRRDQTGRPIKKVKYPVKGSNTTLDLVEYGKELNITVIEVLNLEEAMSYFTHTEYKREEFNVTIDPSYKETMKKVALQLCSRTEELRKKVEDLVEKDKMDNSKTLIAEKALNSSKRASEALEKQDYYSGASFCFNANINYKHALLKGVPKAEFMKIIGEIKEYKLEEKEYQTLRNFQTLLIVKERIEEKDRLVKEALDELNQTSTNISDNAYFLLAFAYERMISAKSWESFFSKEDGEMIDKENMKLSCSLKLADAQERLQYAKLYYPLHQENTEKKIEEASEKQKQEDYGMCILKAVTAKAKSDVLLGTIGIMEDQVAIIVREKIRAAKKEIAKQQGFPILAYSYYEYAESWKDVDEFSALLYAEYAIELASLESYMQKESVEKGVFKDYGTLYDNKRLGYAFFTLIGILIGIGVALLVKKAESKSIKRKPQQTSSKRRLQGKKR